MLDYPEHRRFVLADGKPVDVAAVLRESGAEILMNYLPVGSQKATEFYAQAAWTRASRLVNCIPVFIVCDPAWAQRFTAEGHPLRRRRHQGPGRRDDRPPHADPAVRGPRRQDRRHLPAQHRRQHRLPEHAQPQPAVEQEDLQDRGGAVAVGRAAAGDQIHIGPSDYVPWQKDNKVCFLRIEGRGFGGVPLNLELRLSVEDSPNCAGVAIDAIRCCKLALDHGIGGPLLPASAYFMKHPPVQMKDVEASEAVEQFLSELTGQRSATRMTKRCRHRSHGPPATRA